LVAGLRWHGDVLRLNGPFGFPAATGSRKRTRKCFPAAIGWSGWEGGTLFRTASFHVSYWCLIVTYLAFWMESLIRWQRNKVKRQLLKPHTEPPPR
jgi:hypothetical protein